MQAHPFDIDKVNLLAMSDSVVMTIIAHLFMHGNKRLSH